MAGSQRGIYVIFCCADLLWAVFLHVGVCILLYILLVYNKNIYYSSQTVKQCRRSFTAAAGRSGRQSVRSLPMYYFKCMSHDKGKAHVLSGFQ